MSVAVSVPHPFALSLVVKNPAAPVVELPLATSTLTAWLGGVVVVVVVCPWPLVVEPFVVVVTPAAVVVVAPATVVVVVPADLAPGERRRSELGWALNVLRRRR